MLATAACARIGPDFAPSGINPNGRWSYGWSPTLGGTFTIYSLFMNGTDPSLDGLPLWADPTLIDGSGVHLPAIAINAGTMPVAPNGTYTVQPGQVLAHPGQGGQYSIARFTAATAGNYTVQAAFVGLSGTNGNPITTTDVHLQRNGSDLLTGSLDPNGAGSTYCGAMVVALAVGDTLDFAIGYGNGNYFSDSTGVDGIVCPP